MQTTKLTDFIIISDTINGSGAISMKRGYWATSKQSEMPTLNGLSSWNFGTDSKGFNMMDDQLRMSTSLTSEPLFCSALGLFVSRIKRTGWLSVKDQYYVVGRRKGNSNSISKHSQKEKKKKGSWERKGSLQLYPECFYTELRVIPLTCTHSRVGNILCSIKQCWEAERLRQREGVGVGSWGRERLNSDF